MSAQTNQQNKLYYIPNSSTDPRCLICKQKRCFQCEHKIEYKKSPRKTRERDFYDKKDVVKDHAKPQYNKKPEEKKKGGCCC